VPRLVWDAAGERLFETGIDRGVLYVEGHPGVVWNGLTSFAEAPDGGEATSYWIDGVKYQNVASSEDFEGTLEAYTYPDEFEECEGTSEPFHGLLLTHQKRKSFGLAYRSLVGSDLDGPDHGYKLHLVYNALAEPTQRQRRTTDNTPTPASFSWRITTLAPAITGYRNTAHFIVDTRRVDPLALTALENILYGSDALTPRLPLPAEIFEIFTANTSFVVVDHGDGSWTATGTSEEIVVFGSEFIIDTPAAEFIDAESYTLSSP
jgi:hypothetical protein